MRAVKEEEKENLLKGYSMLLYFAGSMVMFEPVEECITEFWRNGILKKLPVNSHNPRFINAAAELRDSCDDPSTCLAAMRNDYLKLFTGAGSALAPPYESVFLGNEHIIFDKPTLEVREFYRVYGWKSRFEGKIPDDHLGTEILFINLMVDKYLSLEDEACRREMRNEMLRFIEGHPLKWIGRWQEEVSKHAATKCFRGIALLLYASLEDMVSIIRNWD
ncbi:MAG: molecular chaperone TorD family protein [Bacteroidales bacterium]|nr:molecular chaperone TorD family protein [Bacteroidales bacterium]